MASLNFPPSPLNGDVYSLNGVSYRYDGIIGAWLTTIVSQVPNANTTNNEIVFIDGNYANGSNGLLFNKFANTLLIANLSATGSLTTLGRVNANSVTVSANVGIGTFYPNVALDLGTRTDAVLLPVGSTTQRPVLATSGLFRYNTTTNKFEGYGLAGWGSIGGGGATGGGTDDAFYENANTITTDYTITTNKNAMSAGPMTINSGVVVTVPDGSVWTVV